MVARINSQPRIREDVDKEKKFVTFSLNEEKSNGNFTKIACHWIFFELPMKITVICFYKKQTGIKIFQ